MVTISQDAKKLLKNVIRHTDVHNKLQEQEEMWRIHRKRKNMREHRHCSENTDEKRTKHDKLSKKSTSAKPSSFFYTRKLLELEENDKDRWAHSGYRELYPEKFNPDLTSQAKSNLSKKWKKKSKTHKKSKHKKCDKLSKSLSKSDRKFKRKKSKSSTKDKEQL